MSTPEAGALQGQQQRQWLLLRQFGPSALWFLFAKYPVVGRQESGVYRRESGIVELKQGICSPSTLKP